MLGDNFTVILRTYNEEKILPHVLRHLVKCSNLICVDSGSTDRTLDILAAHHVQTFRIPWCNPSRVDPDWYEQVFNLSSTDYILLVYCSHLYSIDLLAELNDITSRNSDLDLIDIPYCHYMYNMPAPAFSTVPSLFGDMRLWFAQKSTHACSFFFNRLSLDFSLFRLHYEFPVRNNEGLRRVTTRNHLTVVRYELYSSALAKESRYSQIEAQDRFYSVARKRLALKVLTAYPKSFFFTYFFKIAFIYGVPGLISSHLAASYKLSVAIALWEKNNNYSSLESFTAFYRE